MTTQEQLYGALLRGPLTSQMSASNVVEPWAGRTTIDSGTASVTVSTAAVGSESLISVLGTEVSSVDPSLVQSGGHLVVNSIVAGVSFALAWASGVAVLQDVIASWMIIPTK